MLKTIAELRRSIQIAAMTPWGQSGSAKRSAEVRRDRIKDADDRTVVSLGSCTDIPALLQRPYCDAFTTMALILRSYDINWRSFEVLCAF